MKESDWESLAGMLVVAAAVMAVVAVVAVVAVMAVMAVMAVVAVVAVMAVMAVMAVVAVVAVVAVAVHINPKASCCLSMVIIAICFASLTQTLPIAFNPPAFVTVICQVTQTASPTIIIHNSATQTIQSPPTIVNSTTIEIASKVSCP